MIEKELREKIAKMLGDDYDTSRDWEDYSERVKDMYRALADKILTLIEEAGYCKVSKE